MKTWKLKKLGTAILFNPKETISKGIATKKVAMEKLIPFNKIISEFDMAEYKGGAKFRNDDTLFARITPCLENGKTAQVTILDKDEVGFGSTEYIVLRAKENISDKDFIYYLSISPKFRDIAIQSMVGSSGRQRVQQNVLENTEMLFPPIIEQKAIADTLSCLDDKIELNNRINKTLEEMAQAIFKSWFVDFEPFQDGEFEDSELGMIPKGWKTGRLENVFDFKNGKKRPTSTGLYPIYGGNGVLGFADDFNNENVVIIGRVGAYCGSLFYERNKCWISDNAISAKSNKDCIAFCYYALSGIKLNERRIGTGQPLLTQSILNNIAFIIPKSDAIEAFENLISPMLQVIEGNNKETQSIITIRDSLLPKLMSGEIRIPTEVE